MKDKPKPSRNKEDYSDPYEFRRVWLWTAMREDDDEKYYPSYSYISEKDLKHLKTKGRTKDNYTHVLKEMEVKETTYPAKMCIKEAFSLIQEVMLTKSKSLRKTMETLTPYQEYDLIALLNHLRECWVDGERGEVELSWKEWYLLKEGGFKKPKNKGKK